MFLKVLRPFTEYSFWKTSTFLYTHFMHEYAHISPVSLFHGFPWRNVFGEGWKKNTSPYRVLNSRVFTYLIIAHINRKEFFTLRRNKMTQVEKAFFVLFSGIWRFSKLNGIFTANPAAYKNTRSIGNHFG